MFLCTRQNRITILLVSEVSDIQFVYIYSLTACIHGIHTFSVQSPVCLLFIHVNLWSDVYVASDTVNKCKSRCLIHETFKIIKICLCFFYFHVINYELNPLQLNKNLFRLQSYYCGSVNLKL